MENGWFFIILGLLFVGISIYYWLFVHEKGTSNPLRSIDEQQNKLDTNAGVIENYLKGSKIESQSKVQRKITDYKIAAIDTIRADTEANHTYLNYLDETERHQEGREKEKIAHQTFLLQQRTEQKEHQLRERLIDAAFVIGVDVATYLKGRLNEMDVLKMEAEARVKISSALLYQRRALEQLRVFREELDKLFDREYELESGNEIAKRDDKLEEVRLDILMLKGKIDGERKRLVQAPEQDSFEGSDTDTEY